MWFDEMKTSAPDWSVIEKTFPHSAAMAGCMQDPIHHGEGDVWTHTRMVYDALDRLGPTTLPERLAVLFHDVEKPATRVVLEDGHVSHPSHARRGAKVSWYDLWQAGLNVEDRLDTYWTIMWHQKVFHMLEKYDRDPSEFMREAIMFNEAGGDWDALIRFARADNYGRICADQGQRNDDLLFLELILGESDLIRSTSVFPDSASRMFYSEGQNRSPFFTAQPPQGSRVTILSGLPGVGKDTWAAQHREGIPVVSADALRKEMGVSWEDNQGTVIQATRERARFHLRTGQAFVWNATNLTRQMRQGLIGLCRSYDAYVEIVAFDAPLKTILKRNAGREAVVPSAAIEALALKWEPVIATEAHHTEWVES
ncbi:MAG: hypothetical protein EOP83_03960 [Verrucomicrobiaceae bacterium]|nr:MAG: hypothetical protein EOP83_03960 [Verrucomicrobiaceae bacterium]